MNAGKFYIITKRKSYYEQFSTPKWCTGTGRHFWNENNIDEFIRLANAIELYEIQVMLTNYKAESLGYQENNLYL